MNFFTKKREIPNVPTEVTENDDILSSLEYHFPAFSLIISLFLSRRKNFCFGFGQVAIYGSINELTTRQNVTADNYNTNIKEMITKSWMTILLFAALKTHVSLSCGLKDPCLNPPTSQPSSKPTLIPSYKPSSRPEATFLPSTVGPPSPSVPSNPTTSFPTMTSNMPSYTSSPTITAITASQQPTSNSTSFNSPTNDLSRITFVDGFDGLWSTLRSTFYTNNPIIECPIGGTVIFHYPNYYHDVTAMADEQHYNNCDFQGSTVLAPLIQNEDFGSVTYYHNCTTPGQVEYLSCSIPEHCEAGQKIVVKTSPTVRAQDEVTGEWLMHVHSLNQVLRVLGQRYDPSTGFLVLDRGFQTEELANKTLEWIWCGLDHCPSFVDIWPNATLADCKGAVYSLMGYVSRKRPIPQWSKAEYYYNKAIDTKGTYECDARSYLTELYLQKGDYETAVFESR
jgi:Plastocyanin-like domain.